MSLSHFFGTDKFSLQQVVTPCIGSKKNLLIFRIIAFAVMFYGFVISIYIFNFNFISNSTSGLKIYLPYFTNQVYIAINIYFALSLFFHWKDKNQTLPKRFKNENINVLLHVFYNVLPPLSFLVSIVFWTLIASKLKWSIYTKLKVQLHFLQHLFQSIFLLIDWYLINIPICFNHIYSTIGIGITFFIFVHLYHAFTGHWLYKFLDTSKKHWFVTYIIVFLFWAAIGYAFVKVQMMKNKKHTELKGKSTTSNNNKKKE